MIFQPRKAALYKLAIEYGIQSPGEISQYLPLGSSIPKPRLESWLRQLFRLPKTFSAQRRYVNQFKLGADPEFVIVSNSVDVGGRVVGSSRADANLLGLVQGPAFGADNNGRLAEIRPYPSRSAVEVLASVLCTLRWLALSHPTVARDFEWHSGAYLYDDGIGGHVHFGRKRPTRKEEVEALDHVEESLVYLGAYPKDQVVRRRQGDARRQIYGALGDFRLQQHGYEYRTFPSWLDSPELAFLTLVVSKLAVQMPSLFRFKGSYPQTEFARLRNFIAYFKGVDDDARLALLLLDRGVPTFRKGDFAPRWGIIRNEIPKKASAPIIIPPSIKPDKQSIQEIFDYLSQGKPIGFRVPEITWGPTEPPKGYRMCIELCNTIQAKGLGEMVWDLCTWAKQPVSIVTGTREARPAIALAKEWLNFFPPDWKARFEGRAATGDLRPGNVSTAPHWREGSNAVWLKKALLNGLLPVWRVKDCKEDSYQVWLEQTKSYKPAKQKYAGSVVFESQKPPL